MSEDKRLQAMRELKGKDLWSEYPGLPRSDWQFEVSEGNTLLGYWDWVRSDIRATIDMERTLGVVAGQHCPDDGCPGVIETDLSCSHCGDDFEGDQWSPPVQTTCSCCSEPFSEDRHRHVDCDDTGYCVLCIGKVWDARADQAAETVRRIDQEDPTDSGITGIN